MHLSVSMSELSLWANNFEYGSLDRRGEVIRFASERIILALLGETFEVSTVVSARAGLLYEEEKARSVRERRGPGLKILDLPSQPT